jgi:acyl dehydratase
MAEFEAFIESKRKQAESGPLISDWLEIDQERIDLFARATNDPDPQHIDPEYARKYSPFGKTIAFGFLTMSLLTHFYRGGVTDSTSGYGLNYGFDRMRLPRAVPVGSRIRGVFRFKSSEIRGEGRVLFAYDVTVEIEGEDKPALSGEWLAMWVEDGLARPEAPHA